MKKAKEKKPPEDKKAKGEPKAPPAAKEKIEKEERPQAEKKKKKPAVTEKKVETAPEVKPEAKQEEAVPVKEKKPKLIIQEGIQGEEGYKVGLRITISVKNPYNAYVAWMGKLMIFPPEEDMHIDCWNYVIQEKLPDKYVKEIQSVWPEYDPDVPITLYDLTEMDKNIRRVLSLGVDYFGGAFKKPNLTMVWNKAETDGLITYHAGCTTDRVLKGLSGTGKTTLTVGPTLEHFHSGGRPLEQVGLSSVQEIGFLTQRVFSFQSGSRPPELISSLCSVQEVGLHPLTPLTLNLRSANETAEKSLTPKYYFVNNFTRYGRDARLWCQPTRITKEFEINI